MLKPFRRPLSTPYSRDAEVAAFFDDFYEYKRLTMADAYSAEDYGSNVVPLQQPQEKREEYQRRKMQAIEEASKYFQEWERRAEKVIKLYRKEQETETSKRRFAMLWANTEIMKPTLYARVPEPMISRRYKDKDPAGRTASEILERATSYCFEKADFDSAIKAAVADLVLPGRGTLWVRFVEDGKLAIDYVHWRDYLHSPARTWSEVTWVAKRSYLSKRQMKRRFPGADLKSMQADNVPKASGMSEQQRKALKGKYSVWEMWDKETGSVCFISPTAKVPLEEHPQPFLDLESFWPCPRPIYATTTTDSMIPVMDYKYYQDQSEEIDDLTRRIGSLTDSLKLVGFYPKGSEAATEIETALQPSVENRMIGVESWAAFAEKGGVKAIVFLPIEEVVNTIKACVELRTQLIQDVYQITGLSDIMRGATDPDETLGAQQLKAQTGSIRVRDRQQEIQRFCRDTLRIMCEIIAEHFSPTMLIQMTNMATPENKTPEKMMEIEGAFKLLKSDKLRGFQIDIETDSTIAPDEDAEKQRRIEFAGAMGTLFKEGLPLVQQVPETLELVGETIHFVARGFRAGRSLEDILEKTLKDLRTKSEQAKQNPPPPNPDQIKAETDKKRFEELEKPKAQAETNEIQARADKAKAETQHVIQKTELLPGELALKQDQMFLADDQKTQDREMQGAEAEADRQQGAQQFEAEAAESAAQFDMTREDKQAAQASEMAQEGPNGSGPPAPRKLNGASQAAPQGAIGRLLEALAQSTAQNGQAIAMLAQVMASPTVVETPRGTYVARKAMQ